jgi:hypothetical protein
MVWPLGRVEHVVAAVAEVVQRPPLAGVGLLVAPGVEDQVVDVGQRVEVDEAGQDNAGAQVDPLVVAGRGTGRRAGVGDAAVLDEHGRIAHLDVSGAVVGQQVVGGQQGAHALSEPP